MPINNHLSLGLGDICTFKQHKTTVFKDLFDIFFFSKTLLNL